jgi:hypothetical protein
MYICNNNNNNYDKQHNIKINVFDFLKSMSLQISISDIHLAEKQFFTWVADIVHERLCYAKHEDDRKFPN